MRKNAVVVYDETTGDSFLIEHAAPQAPLPRPAGASCDPRGLAILSDILHSHGYHLTPQAAPAARQKRMMFRTTDKALAEAIGIFETFVEKRFATRPVALGRARVAAEIYRRDLLARARMIEKALPISAIIWDRDNGLTRGEATTLGGDNQTAVALRVILFTLPHALAQMEPAARKRGTAAFRILSEVWDILAEEICAASERPKTRALLRRA
jgi:hypothetical protein